VTIDAALLSVGRLHPLVLHAPIGIVIGLVAVEVLALLRRKPLGSEVRSTLIWLIALSASAAALSGWFLRREGGYPAATADLHQWLGIAMAGSAVLAALLHARGRAVAYGVMLLATAGVMVPTGHFGATMTHGADFLLSPFSERTSARLVVAAEVPDAAALTVFASDIQPILNEYCVSCHGAERSKGKLSLHSSDGITKGGSSGPSLIAGDAESSELLRRLRLPLDDDDHMPPDGKPQPTADEIARIARWIADGASFEALSDAPAIALETEAAEVKPIAAPDAAAIVALKQRLVHVEPIAQGSPLLIVDVSAVAASFGDEDAQRLLGPLKDQIADLSLARSQVTDATMTLVGAMPQLKHLDLGSTGITDRGVAMLADAAAPQLETLVLTQTAVSDGAAASIASLPALQRLYLWKSAMTNDAADVIKAARPDAVIDLGIIVAAAVIAREMDEPAPATQPAAVSLKPVNALCPVTGQPIDPAMAIVYQGRVVGFCCKHCLAKFLDDPAAHAGNIE